jgi:hypothetical protein
MKSSLTGKSMRLCKSLQTITYKGENFEVLYYYYLCEDTQERYTTDELDELNLAQVQLQYKAKAVFV